jgi:hypothetical protein
LRTWSGVDLALFSRLIRVFVGPASTGERFQVLVAKPWVKNDAGFDPANPDRVIVKGLNDVTQEADIKACVPLLAPLHPSCLCACAPCQWLQHSAMARVQR